jgi:hypothetical protein
MGSNGRRSRPAFICALFAKVSAAIAESAFVRQPKCAPCAKKEVSAIDTTPNPKVNVQESIANAKVYCKQNPESFVSLRDYSGDIYDQTCAVFAAEQQATDPSYKLGSD